jgi:hypothetical protein
MLGAVMLNVVNLGVAMLNVVALCLALASFSSRVG